MGLYIERCCNTHNQYLFLLSFIASFSSVALAFIYYRIYIMIAVRKKMCQESYVVCNNRRDRRVCYVFEEIIKMKYLVADKVESNHLVQ